jgi:hypothetical protein
VAVQQQTMQREMRTAVRISRCIVCCCTATLTATGADARLNDSATRPNGGEMWSYRLRELLGGCRDEGLANLSTLPPTRGAEMGRNGLYGEPARRDHRVVLQYPGARA